MSNKALPIPEWLKSSAVYQVNLRTFNDQGTINALRAELPFLKTLGFEIVYLCPIFEQDDSEDRTYWSKRQKASKTENPKNPYRINDYFKIDHEYGCLDDLAGLIDDAHALHMKVLLDLVYMHIGPNAPILKKHPEFAARDRNGQLRCTSFNFPVINFGSMGLREYLWANMTYFVGALDVDGFRCDVGDAVPDDFWMEGRRRIQAIKPDAILINEGNKFQRLATSFDGCYTFGWHEELYKVLVGTLSVKELVQNEQKRLEAVPENGLLMRDMDNHDTVTDWPVRVETLAGHDGMELILVANYALAGIPMVYSGNELADAAKLSMFANRFHRGAFQVTDRETLKTTEAGIRRQAIITELNRLLKETDAMQSAVLEWIDTPHDNLLAFCKKAGAQQMVFFGNLGKQTIEIPCNPAFHSIRMDNRASIRNDRIHLQPYGYILAEAEAT